MKIGPFILSACLYAVVTAQRNHTTTFANGKTTQSSVTVTTESFSRSPEIPTKTVKLNKGTNSIIADKETTTKPASPSSVPASTGSSKTTPKSTTQMLLKTTGVSSSTKTAKPMTINQILGTFGNGLNTFLNNIPNTTLSNNSGNTSNVQYLVKLLGNFLPQDSRDKLQAIVSNPSSVTPENLLQLALPIVSSIGVQFLTANGVSETCRKDLGLIVNGISSGKEWALKMLDAMFKFPADAYGTAMGGSPKLLGSFDECVAITATTGSIEHFQGKYCRASTKVSLSGNVLTDGATLVLGLCVSSSCSSTDIEMILSNLELQIFNQTVPYKPDVYCVETKVWGTDMIVVTCVLSVLGTIVLFATLYDAFGVQLNKTNEKQGKKPTAATAGKVKETYAMDKNGFSNGGYVPTEPEDGNSGMEIAETNIDKATSIGSVSVHVDTPPANRPTERGIAEQLFLSFSIYSNGVKLLSTNQAGSLGAVNGVRFLSMAWVILGHTIFFTAGFDTNLVTYFYSHFSDWTFMALPYATVSVDSFFALSGVLVAYLTLKELKKVGGASKLNWFMFYFHRFWRLTPPYMLVIMVGTVVLPYVVNGPMSYGEDLPFMDGCRTKWWANLLYVNNYVTEDMCMGWSWYLSNDMQFYIISPLIILPYYYNAIAGAVSSGVFLLATIAATGVVARNHEYPAQQMSPLAHHPKDADYSKNIYLPSYARMGPYIVGLCTGYLLYKCKGQCRIPRVLNVACWIACLGVTCSIIYGQYTDGDSHIMSLWENVIFLALNRTGWGIAVCWIIFACGTGNGGWINEVLSWKPFIPLGRLTYCAYLVHPLVMLVYNENRRTAEYFTHYEAIYLFLGHLTMSYGVAFVTSLFFESPMMGLEKVVFKKGKK